MMSRFDMLYRSEAHTKMRLCDHAQCNEVAEYNAPASKQLPASFPLSSRTEYAMEGDAPPKMLGFCLTHIREYNKAWDFFEGMSNQEIEDFRMDAMLGHRKARKDISSASVEKLYDKAMKFRGGKSANEPKKPKIPETERDALITLGLSYPLTKAVLKAKYRELVKKYHPDKAGKSSEERFKQISQAYNVLKHHVEV